MKHILYYFIFSIFIVSCSDDEKAIETVLNETERGAVLRTIDRIQPNFIHEDLSSTFSLLIEEQSIETGNQFQDVVLFVKHIDRSSNGIGIESAESILRMIDPDEFELGPVDLPRLLLTISYQEVLDALSLETSLIEPGDQFEIRMELRLLDGRSFSNDSGSAVILTDYCFFKSPYRYVINVIEPIDDIRFTGDYFYEILEVDEVDLDFTGLNMNGFTSITNNSTPNVRTAGIYAESLEFTIAGDFIYPKIYQTLVSLAHRCRDSESTILAGPNENSFGQYDLLDDSVFELDALLDTEGSAPKEVRFRFTKQ